LLNYFFWTNSFNSLNDSSLLLSQTINWYDFQTLNVFEYLTILNITVLGYRSLVFSTQTFNLTSNYELILLFLNEFNFKTISLVYSLYLDKFLEVSSLAGRYFNLLQSDSLNPTFYFMYSPEYVYFMLNQFSSTESITEFYHLYVYDNFELNLPYLPFDGISFILWLFVFIISLLLTFTLFRNTSFTALNHPLTLRVYLLLTSIASEYRLQFDFTFTFLVFIFIIWFPLLMTYDDTNVELVETFHLFITLTFLALIAYLLFRYSVHYFSFLENSVTDGFSVQFIAKQFVRDMSNTFALFLRFFLLIFRLNIYDGLDDFLDSYFIFFIDFDEDSYFDELPFMFYTGVLLDNHEDLSIQSLTEFTVWFDLYSKYFIILGKFIYFWIFILEEFFRVALAFYISYLIIFEVHSVNTSYNENTGAGKLS